ncbi:MAG: type II toxin-antitoxin system VapC family toxin [Candidatus Limnocylindrales bacterium]
MPDRAGILYADSSALVKLAVLEAETDALRDELEHWHDVATSVITEIELARAVARVGAEGIEVIDEVAVWTITAAVFEIELTRAIRRVAAELEPAELRALDCIHIAGALSLGDDLAAVLTYDKRMQEAATRHGLQVLAPS